MILLAATETLSWVAGTPAAISGSVFAMEIASSLEIYKTVAQAQLPNIVDTAYTVPAATQSLIKTINLVNTTAIAVTDVNLFVRGTAATNRIIGFTIPANGSATYNTNGWKVLDSSGSIVTTISNPAITDDNTTNAVMYPTWVAGNGNPAYKISSTKWTFNPSTGLMTTTMVNAAHNGTLGATTPATANVTTLTATGTTTLATSLTGIAKLAAGVVSTAVAGTDIKTIGGASILGSGELTLENATIDGTNTVGFRNIPQNSNSAAYTLVLSDAGKYILHPSADVTARIFTIPANASIAFPIGAAITFVNQSGAGVITIAITTDVMRLAGAGTIGNRTLAANGLATAIKLTATEWIISGVGLT